MRKIVSIMVDEELWKLFKKWCVKNYVPTCGVLEEFFRSKVKDFE